eukprot:SAG31_NODE_24488_length_480_cov_1.060367_2_plen_30_part_01
MHMSKAIRTSLRMKFGRAKRVKPFPIIATV